MEIGCKHVRGGTGLQQQRHFIGQVIEDVSAEPVGEGELRGGVTGRWRSAG
jgi:hypothetical protein